VYTREVRGRGPGMLQGANRCRQNKQGYIRKSVTCAEVQTPERDEQTTGITSRELQACDNVPSALVDDTSVWLSGWRVEERAGERYAGTRGACAHSG
jgi:hypothetical protein